MAERHHTGLSPAEKPSPLLVTPPDAVIPRPLLPIGMRKRRAA